jgi:hypothetical protein
MTGLEKIGFPGTIMGRRIGAGGILTPGFVGGGITLISARGGFAGIRKFPGTGGISGMYGPVASPLPIPCPIDKLTYGYSTAARAANAVLALANEESAHPFAVAIVDVVKLEATPVTGSLAIIIFLRIHRGSI